MVEPQGLSRNIKVAVVIPTHWSYLMGGSQYQAKLLVEELYRSHGADIAWFAGRAATNCKYPDHRVVCVGRANSLRRFGYFWDYFRLLNQLEEYAPDVVYQRVGCAYTGISARYAKRSGTPLIWHVSSEKDCRRKPAIRKALRRPHTLIESHLAHKGITHAHLIVAQSRDQIRMLHDNFGRKADRLIRNFAHVPPPRDKHAGRFTVVWIANLKALKRPELFLEIAALLEERSDVDFVMVGQAYLSNSMQNSFERIVQNQKNVRYLGPMSFEEVNSLLDRSSLLVNTSEWEGFSNTFIQAWMRAVPVLTLDVNPDGLLTDSLLGRSHVSTLEIADTIRELASNLDKLEDMGEKSREFAIQHFSMSNATELSDLIIQTARKNLFDTADKARQPE